MNKVKQTFKQVAAAQEKGARDAVLEELFYDMYRHRFSIYKINFFRGIFFGFGTVLGGTILVAIVIWLLSLFANVFPPLKDFFDGLSALLDAAKK